MSRRIVASIVAIAVLSVSAWIAMPPPAMAADDDLGDLPLDGAPASTPARPPDVSADPDPASTKEAGESAEADSELAEDAPGEPFEAGMEARTDRDSLEQIRVVARRRSENLEDTPVAVTALGRNQLNDAQVREMNQIQDLVPNLTWITGANGQGGSVIIRGVGKGAEDLVFDPGVGIYVDGVLLSRDAGQLLSMVDVEQIEVLRGPQGTLFGKNNVGGAINMISVKPQPDFEAMMLVGYGNLNSIRTRAMVNMPITEETLFVRVAWASETNDGYMYNADSGQDSSDVRQLATMGSIRALPTENLTIDVSGSWSRNHAHSRGGKCVYIGQSIAAQFVSGLPPSQGGFTEAQLQEQCDRSLDLPRNQFASDVALLSDIMSYGVWGTLAYDFGNLGIVENVVAKSITAWREQKPRIRDDTDMTSIPIIQRNLLAGQPTFFPDQKRASTQRQITQEFQLQNTWWDERIHSTTGVYLYWDQARTDQEIWSLGAQYLAPDPELLRGLVPNLQQTSIDNDDVAVYHQSTWDIIEALSLTAGFRWTQETKQTGLSIYQFTSPPPMGETSAPYLKTSDSDSEKYSEWTPTASLVGKAPADWIEPLGFDTLNAYFTYARGFKGGGFSAIQGGQADELLPFRPEFLDSWELGIKSVAWNSRVRTNIAGFWGRYQDMQVAVTRAGNTFTVERIVENAAKAQTRGVELELQALPLDGLLLTASIGYLNAFFDQYTNSANNVPRPAGDLPPNTIDRSGDRFNNAPRLQTNLTGQYTLDYTAGPQWLEGSVTPRIEWIYESGVWLAGREATSLHQGYVNRLNARLSWRFNDDQTELAFWGKNLTDAYYFRSAIAGTIPTYGIALRYYEPPRTYGFEMAHRF